MPIPFREQAPQSLVGPVLLAFGLLISGCTGPGEAVSPPASSPSGALQLMPLGDSITDGYNIPGGYRPDLFQKLSAQVPRLDFVGSQQNGPATLSDRDHEGHSGRRIDEIAARVDGWLVAQQPETVLLMVGTNDVIQEYELGSAPARLGALLDKISARLPAATVLVASIPTMSDPTRSERAKTYNAALPGVVSARAAQGQKVRFVDVGAALTPADLADGVHPNQGGYGKLADAWYRALLDTPGALTP